MPVNIIDTLKPKNGLSFPVVEAIDVFVENYGNLAEAVSHFATDVMIEAINTVLSGKANTSNVNTATSALQAQIDQIAQAAGTGSADTEVAQARVENDGPVYPTLKARLDSEEYKTTIDIREINEALNIKWNVPSGITSEQGYYTISDPTLHALNTYTTLTLDVTNVKRARVTGKVPSGEGLTVCMFFDISNNLIGHIFDSTSSISGYANNAEIAIPNGTKYLKVISQNSAATAKIEVATYGFDADEIVDARTSDEVEYSSLSQRLDTDKSSIKADILEIDVALGKQWIAADTTSESGYYTITEPYLHSLSSYTTLTLNVENITKCRITGKVPSGNGLTVCMFFNSDDELIGHLYDSTATVGGEATNAVVYIPENTQYIKVISQNSLATAKIDIEEYAFNADEINQEINRIDLKYQYIPSNIEYTDISDFDTTGIDEEKVVVRVVPNGTAILHVESMNILHIASATSSNVTSKNNSNGGYDLSFAKSDTGWPDIYEQLQVGGLTGGQQYTLSFDVRTVNGARPRIYVFNSAASSALATVTSVKTNQFDGDSSCTFIVPSGDTSVIIRLYPASNLSDYATGTTIPVSFNKLMINSGTTALNYSTPYSVTASIAKEGLYEALVSDGTIITISNGSAFIGEDSKSSKATIVCFGDSITGAFTEADRDYPALMASITGNKVYNVGFGGARMGAHPNSKYDNFCMYKLVDAIYNNDFTAQEADTSGAETYPLRLSTLESIDFSKVDIVTIAYGTNDWGGGAGTVKPVDNENNPYDTTNFYGATRYSIKRLHEKYPHLKIIVVSPYYRYDTTSGEDSDTGYRPTYNPDYSLTDYVNALEKSAYDMKVPFINMYNTMGVNMFNRTYYFDGSDGVHFNSNGMKLLAERLAAFITATYML